MESLFEAYSNASEDDEDEPQPKRLALPSSPSKRPKPERSKFPPKFQPSPSPDFNSEPQKGIMVPGRYVSKRERALLGAAPVSTAPDSFLNPSVLSSTVGNLSDSDLPRDILSLLRSRAKDCLQQGMMPERMSVTLDCHTKAVNALQWSPSNEVSNQMLELYEQNRVPPAQGSEVDGSTGGGPSHHNVAKTTAVTEEHSSKQVSSCSAPDHSYADNHGVPQRVAQNLGKNNGTTTDVGSAITGQKVDLETDSHHHTDELSYKENSRDVSDRTRPVVEHVGGEEKEKNNSKSETAEAGEWRDDGVSHKSSGIVGRNVEVREGPVGQSPKEAIKMIDRDKVKAALEKRRKSRGEMSRKKDVMDEDDLIERELEDGIELAAEDEKNRRERGQSGSKVDNQDDGKVREELLSGHHAGTKSHTSWGTKAENAVVEEGEMLDDASPALNSRKRKAGRSPDWHSEGKKWNDPAPNNHYHGLEDGNRKNWSVYADREPKRHAHENHL